MRSRLRFTIVAICLLAALISMMGCNTWQGAGRDAEVAGDAMQGQ